MGRMQISGFTDDAVYHCFSGSGSDPGTGKEVQGIKKAEKAFDEGQVTFDHLDEK